MIWTLLARLAWLLNPLNDPRIDELIRPPVPKYVGSDEGLRARSQERRHIADRMKNRGHAVESGGSASDLLRRVK